MLGTFKAKTSIRIEDKRRPHSSEAVGLVETI
jgi:hypothetical protein